MRGEPEVTSQSEGELRSDLLSSRPRSCLLSCGSVPTVLEPILLLSPTLQSPPPILVQQGEQGKASLQSWGEGFGETSLGSRDPEEGAGAACPDFSKRLGPSAKIQNYLLPQFLPLPTFGFCGQEPCLAAVQRGDWRGGEEGRVKWKVQDDGGLSWQRWSDLHVASDPESYRWRHASQSPDVDPKRPRLKSCIVMPKGNSSSFVRPPPS